MNKNNKKKKVVIAMSGGVDSSVSAALLKEAGFDVIGVFMKCWNVDDFNGIDCTAEEDEYWARRVAQKIRIPFYSIDLVEEYKKRVVDYFVSEYARGRTPNPDVMCNNEIKFGVFFDKVINEFGADYMATGHYARIMPDYRLPTTDYRQVKLLKGFDKNKDQSYFLHRVLQKKLVRTIFPIGEYTKPKVREMAKNFNLPNAEKKDSQGLCFIGKVDISQFLAEYLPQKQGVVVTTSGKKVGVHRGAQYYTIGQRRGVGTGGGGIPYYVVNKDIKTNIVTVGSRYDEGLFNKRLELEDVVWISSKPNLSRKLQASIRYRQKPQDVVIKFGIKAGVAPTSVALEFIEPQRAITSGQSAVIYDGDIVLGGGIIK